MAYDFRFKICKSSPTTRPIVKMLSTLAMVLQPKILFDNLEVHGLFNQYFLISPVLLIMRCLYPMSFSCFINVRFAMRFYKDANLYRHHTFFFCSLYTEHSCHIVQVLFVHFWVNGCASSSYFSIPPKFSCLVTWLEFLEAMSGRGTNIIHNYIIMN